MIMKPSTEVMKVSRVGERKIKILQFVSLIKELDLKMAEIILSSSIYGIPKHQEKKMKSNQEL